MSKLCGDRVSDDRVEHDSCSLITPAQLASLKRGRHWSFCTEALSS